MQAGSDPSATKLLEAFSSAPPPASLAYAEPRPNAVRGSPGRRDADVERYSKDGLRTAMTANYPAMERELQRHAPDHLPVYEWYWHTDAMVEEWKAKGLPPTPGRRARAAKDPWVFQDRSF